MSATKSSQALFEAIQMLHVEQVRELLSSGISANQKYRGQYPLVVAASSGSVEIVLALLAAGADVNVSCEIPQPRLGDERLLMTDLPDGENLQQLISEATADADEATKDFYAGFIDFVNLFQQETVRLQTLAEEDGIVSQVEVNPPDQVEMERLEDEQQQTALIAAIAADHLDIVKTLLQAGARVNRVELQEPVPLVLAVKQGRVEMVQVLLEAGADPNQIDLTEDCTALAMAIKQRQPSLIQLLLAAGASPSVNS